MSPAWWRWAASALAAWVSAMLERVSFSCTVIGTVSQAILVASTASGVFVAGGGMVGVGYGIFSA